MWRSDLSKIEVIDTNNFIEYSKNGVVTNFNITKKEKTKIYEFDMENKNIKGHWTGKFEELDKDITEILFIERIEVNNIIMKTLSKIYLKNYQKTYIRDLKKEIENH